MTKPNSFLYCLPVDTENQSLLLLRSFFATIVNHALAAYLGVVVADFLTPETLKWVLIISFVAMAGWVLIPDKLDDDEAISNRGPFVASFIAFFYC